MKMRKSLICAMVVTFIFVAVDYGIGASKPIKLVYNCYLSINHTVGLNENLWLDEVERRTNGRVKFERHFGGSLFKGKEQLRAVSNGLVDLSDVAPGYNINLLPLSGGLQMPFLTKKPPVMFPVTVDLLKNYPPFAQEFSKNNIVMMMPTLIPPSWIYMNKKNPVKCLNDLKGKRIRAYGWLATSLKLLGVNATGLAASEVYSALEQGVLDGNAGMNVDCMGSMGLYEATKYFIDIGIGQYAVLFLCMNKDSWNKLPKDIQQIMKDVSKEGYERWLKSTGQQMKKYLKIFMDSGIEISQLTEAERKKVSEIGSGAHDIWVKKQKKNIPAEEFMSKVKKLIAKYEPTVDYKEDPWAIYQQLISGKK
jgi:TRAP-type C4-dicarboxylate transport system substrate-binding protein